MASFGSPQCVVVLDNVDPDNIACALMAHRTYLDIVAVIVSGRPANPDPEADSDDADPQMTRNMHQANTSRMKGALVRSGFSTPVFVGLVAPHTLVPHKVHIDEYRMDYHCDTASSEMLPDGNFKDALKYLRGLRGDINLIVGGPMGEVAAMMQDPKLASRLGLLTAQFGAFGFGDVKLMGGGLRQFNVACDPVAANDVLTNYPGPIYMIPTDITKQPAIGFDDPDELSRFGITDEVVNPERVFYPAALAPRGERIYLHDVSAALMMQQLAQYNSGTNPVVYNYEPVCVTAVPHQAHDRTHWGEIDITWGTDQSRAPRFVATSQDAELYRSLLKRRLNS